jgi:UDP-N-acetylglucosamine:LPS N-acetylglucosamine transferase
MSADLLPTLRAILGDEARRADMAARARALARPDGAERIADALLALAKGAA